MDQRQQILQETIAARTKALELLKSLTAAQTGADPSAKDLFKRVTGQSSIENSIAATRRAVEAYDRVITQLQSAETPEVKVNRDFAAGRGPGPNEGRGEVGASGAPGARS